MRPFTKDSQPVVIKGRRKSKLEAPKSKSAAALVKRKNRNARRKHNDGADDLAKEPPCQFVPVRRKPLGEYMNLEGPPVASPSPSLQGMRMSYAAAVQTGLGVKVMISPRLKKSNKPGKGKAIKITADTKFRIFDEQPKPHIVRVDPKVFRADVEQNRARLKSCKSKKPITQKASKSLIKLNAKTEPDDADIKALELKFKRLACNVAGTATVAAVQTARNLNSIQGNSLTASNGQVKHNKLKSPPAFVDSVSYISFHHERLHRLIKNQSICVICLQSPEPMKVPQFEDKHFKYLEEAALLAQNRTMLRLWLNSDQLIC
ncbi:uncharacterized protein LOC115762304 [Drosophila novamexicana]|uniref:uncharacterized protein LOC115762304 n=1 Tax=Drosophila novamexicana TaxID=47314 RepID=UPI0011E5D630|nr:uncharacterized protein LOC115762304 [Drosophila novamexicana]